MRESSQSRHLCKGGRFHGPQLDQADLDVWEQALQLARTGGLGRRIQFTASQFLSLDVSSSVEFGQRMALKKRPLAHWLHGYYSSHAKPFPVKVETLHRLCGSQNTAIKGFKQELKSALEKLEEVTHWRWEIDASDLVHLSKVPTVSQARYLLRRGLVHSRS